MKQYQRVVSAAMDDTAPGVVLCASLILRLKNRLKLFIALLASLAYPDKLFKLLGNIVIILVMELLFNEMYNAKVI